MGNESHSTMPAMVHESVAPPVFNSKTRCSSALLLLLELASTVVLSVLYSVAPLHTTILILSCVVAAASMLCGILGICRSTPAAVASFMVAIGSCFGFSLLGGLCILFTSDVELEVAAFLNKSLVPSVDEDRQKLLSDAKNTLASAAAIIIANAVIHLCFCWHLRRLVGDRRAAIAFLQIFSVITFPLSLFLILGGNYVVDTGTLASAPYAGLAIFASGVVMLVVALLAFIGGSFEYRRLLSICYLLSALIGTCSVVLAIACFAGRSYVQDNVLENWDSIRILLPPTAQIAYDREKFGALMQSNLNAVAYVWLLSGLFILTEAAMSLSLMRHATSWKRQLARAKCSMRDLKETAVNIAPIGLSNIPQRDSPTWFHEQWILLFGASTRRQRIVMRIVILLIVLAVAFILAIMSANVVFVTKCNSIGSRIASASVHLVNSSEEYAADVVQLHNSFSRGTIIISAASTTTGSVDMEFFGSEGGAHASALYEKKTMNGTINIDVQPMDTTRFLWLDGSCQRSRIEVAIPQDRARALVVNSSASVVVNASNSGTLLLQGLSIITTQSSIACSNVDVEGDKLLMQTTSGDISVDGLTIDASNLIAAESPARVYSALGIVSLNNIALSQCDLHVETGASSLSLSDIQSSVSTGRSHIEAKSASASISAETLEANWITIESDSGDIDGIDLATDGNSAFMGRLEVTTVSGDISLEQIAASGTVHIESASGKISLQLKAQTFTGMYYMRSEYGTISIRRSNYSSDVIMESVDSVDGLEKHGSINCDSATNNCLSYGGLYLRSNLGDIEIVLGCDSFSCG